jgi:hypothetical protein
MPTPTEPVHEPCFSRGKIAIGDADFLKTELGTPLLDLARERNPVDG